MLNAFESKLKFKPNGFRAPYWIMTTKTLELLRNIISFMIVA